MGKAAQGGLDVPDIQEKLMRLVAWLARNASHLVEWFPRPESRRREDEDFLHRARLHRSLGSCLEI